MDNSKIYVQNVTDYLNDMKKQEKGIISAIQMNNQVIALKAMGKFLADFDKALRNIYIARAIQARLTQSAFMAVGLQQRDKQKVDKKNEYGLVEAFVKGKLPSQMNQFYQGLSYIDKSPAFHEFCRINKLQSLQLPPILKKRVATLKMKHKFALNQKAQKDSKNSK